MGNLAQSITGLHLEPMCIGQDPSRFHRPAKRRRVDGRQAAVGQTCRQSPRLLATFVRKLNIGGAGKAILGRQQGRAVSDKKNPSTHCKKHVILPARIISVTRNHTAPKTHGH
jgi:hypothetical protein